MRICVAFFAGVFLISGTAAEGETGHKGGACDSFGNRFGNGPCKEPPGSSDTFFCDCPSDQFYFDAVQQMCLYKNSCKTTQCAIGRCIEQRNRTYCSCTDVHNLTSRCKVEEGYKDECERKGGQAVVTTHPWLGARCVCGDWATMDTTKRKCVPITCLKPTFTCKELCEKRVVGKDPRCCQGWNESDCTKEPEKDAYCSAGSIMNQQGKCQDACSAALAQHICEYGCERTRNGSRAYQCSCPREKQLAEDGIACKVVHKERLCRDDEKQACRSDQQCVVRDGEINCSCRFEEHLVDGIYTGKCGANNCHERFQKRVIYDGKQQCRCPWKDWSKTFITDKCTLQRYYYTVSFKPNISLEHEDCDFYAPRVLDAMKTAMGSRVHSVEILNCTDKIEARLILNEPLPELLRKRLQTCEYQQGEFCMLYPNLPIEKYSATEIEEENLCESVLKEQEAGYNGTNKCVKHGNLFWFKCARGFREVNQTTLGRLRRSICEPGTDDPMVEPATKVTTAEPGKSAGSSNFKPQLLQLLLVYGAVITLLHVLLH